jgi:hypothetical protein
MCFSLNKQQKRVSFFLSFFFFLSLSLFSFTLIHTPVSFSHIVTQCADFIQRRDLLLFTVIHFYILRQRNSAFLMVNKIKSNVTVLPIPNNVCSYWGSTPQIQKPTTKYSLEPERCSFIYLMFFQAEVFTVYPVTWCKVPEVFLTLLLWEPKALDYELWCSFLLTYISLSTYLLILLYFSYFCEDLGT